MKKGILFLLLSTFMFCDIADARKVSGTVMCGEEKLSDVIVTDGKNFTQTKKGKFKFEIEDNAEFVYIITPSGYVADWSTGVPAFYQTAEGKDKFFFNLEKTVAGDDYSFIAVSDPQTRTDEDFAKFAAEPMTDLCRTAQSLEGQAVGIILGDICYDELPHIEKYKKEIVRTGIPFYPVVGNHDHDRSADGGDLEATAAYRRMLGPENYAFFLGKDVVIALDNIIYDENKRYKEGYADHVLAFVKGLARFIPASSDIYVVQHSPLRRRRQDTTNEKIVNANDLLSIVHGHKTTFIAGHSHVFHNHDYSKDVIDQNIAAICGAWWDTIRCTDGTPRGYKVYSKTNGKLEWYYKPVDYDKDHQMELFMPGESVLHPNSIVLNIWDWDDYWKIEWFEDGKPMGTVEPQNDRSPAFSREINKVYADQGKEAPDHKKPTVSAHYLHITPSQYAKKVTIIVESRFGQKWIHNVDMSDYIDVQAHRGGAGLMPENTIEAMKNALDMGVNTLELDLQVSADGQVVVSHDPYFHHRYATRPDGTPVRKEDKKEYIYRMPYSEVAKYDVGKRPSDVWPEKACIETVKPLASDLIDFVENYTKENGMSPVRYNIEIKSKDADGESINWPAYDSFVRSCALLLHSKDLGDRLVVQSFDVRALEYMKERYPEFILSYLVDAKEPDFDTFMKKLKITPEWLSPHHSITTEEMVKKCHEKGMKIVPWTVDAPEDIKRMIDLKVDAIISNYPDRVIRQTRGY